MAVLMHFFIFDLYQQLEIEYKKENTSSIQKVYRGQLMSKYELDRLTSNDMTNTLFVNHFFSATKDRNTAMAFAGIDGKKYYSDNDELQQVLLEIEITSDMQKPLANIEGVSYFQWEGEILLSIGTSFKKMHVTKNDGFHYWLIQLKTID
ncbi:unnamed protein product, partial [Rotaria sp. Silwood2]